KVGAPADSSNAVRVDPPAEGVFRWYGTRMVSFDVTEKLLPQREYSVTVNRELTSLNGKKLTGNNTFTFRTEYLSVRDFFTGATERVSDLEDVPLNTIPFSVLIANELHELNSRYLGTDTVTTREGEIYDCIKFSVELVEGFIFKPGDEMFVWVTNDANRVPVLVEAQIRVGSVKAMLKSASGLRNPVTARID
ncbi:MAG: DUF3108 domain-containing protein, partial [Bacteroidales bacterium]